MNKKERKVLQWVDTHLPMILLLACTLLGAAIRFKLRGITSGDYTGYLQPWYDEISKNGIFKQVGDDNLLYQMMIWLMTKVKVAPLYAYKIFSCFFDMVLAITAFVIVKINAKRVRESGHARCTGVLRRLAVANRFKENGMVK